MTGWNPVSRFGARLDGGMFGFVQRIGSRKFRWSPSPLHDFAPTGQPYNSPGQRPV
ncbi:hypothetical protein RB4250 [Rhodopirellula baltica SH 1]|uniref:Uncharacterized protein n=1 Tax=Rhodopirellula baltica (strain DSM 10527 / NCIMB 13988 / SH1) TaxID=243090 RepID=Q7USX4_RHOBA|nr:hypothetical protein RB4250 [Rhodopirellula baltica SH 1]